MERTALAQAIYRASHRTGELRWPSDAIASEYFVKDGYLVFDEMLSREFVGAEATR